MPLLISTRTNTQTPAPPSASSLAPQAHQPSINPIPTSIRPLHPTILQDIRDFNMRGTPATSSAAHYFDFPPEEDIDEAAMSITIPVQSQQQTLSSLQSRDPAGFSQLYFLLLTSSQVLYKDQGCYQSCNSITRSSNNIDIPLGDMVFENAVLFLDIILQNWLLNLSGNPNSFVEVDLIQEYLNFWIKTFYKAHGLNTSWEWLFLISPCVEVLHQLASSFNSALGSDQSVQHTTPNLSCDIMSLIDSLHDHHVYEKINR
ncbi:hypothetical protein AN958_01559 [Leucoagaricus sp. SymC.cos]|nr:hypothetical protein AN958_01559 [Leucoagaricus sp. SymC.cos]